MALASEWGHWYDREGNPVYEIAYADPSKGMRAVTLADARKMNLLPGVTGIINCAAKPGLERWKVVQGILSALTLPKIDGEPLDAFADRAMQDSKEQSRKAAEKGTAIHAAIEQWYLNPIWHEELEYGNIIWAVKEKIKEQYNEQTWSAEKSFASPLGYGCKIDLVSPEAIIDFKTKEFSDVSKKLAWAEHAMQLVANRDATGYDKAKCANVFVSTSVPGLVHIHEWDEKELYLAQRKFHALLQYWMADRNYYPLPK
jgi:hypothetical protein